MLDFQGNAIHLGLRGLLWPTRPDTTGEILVPLSVRRLHRFAYTFGRRTYYQAVRGQVLWYVSTFEDRPLHVKGSARAQKSYPYRANTVIEHPRNISCFRGLRQLQNLPHSPLLSINRSASENGCSTFTTLTKQNLAPHLLRFRRQYSYFGIRYGLGLLRISFSSKYWNTFPRLMPICPGSDHLDRRVIYIYPLSISTPTTKQA